MSAFDPSRRTLTGVTASNSRPLAEPVRTSKTVCALLLCAEPRTRGLLFCPLPLRTPRGRGRSNDHRARGSSATPQPSVLQRPIDHADEIADSPLVHAEFCVVISV